MRYVAAAMSAVVWGSGQVFNKQRIKGLAFFICQILFFGADLMTGTLAVLRGDVEAKFRNCGVFVKGVWGLITLGDIPRKSSVLKIGEFDHSTMLMLNGLIAGVFILIAIAVWIGGIRDAYGTRKNIENGEVLSSRSSFERGFEKYFEFIAISPGMILVMIFSIVPVLFSLLVAFTNYNSSNVPPKNLLSWVGFDNFVNIVKIPVWSRTFVGVFAWTVVWAFLAAFTTYFFGMLQATLLSSKMVKGVRFWRSIYMLPWAIPAFVTILTFNNAFHMNGPINRFLMNMGLTDMPIPFIASAGWARTILVVVNLWVGFPYFMALISGVMATVNQEMYEAAQIDGANALQIFQKITFPVIFAATVPQLIFSVTFNFNNFGMVFFLTRGGPGNVKYSIAGSTDLLISWIYKLTYDERNFNYASVMSILIFVVLASVSAANLLRTRAFKED